MTQIFACAPFYSEYVKAQIPAALCAIHNFIHTHNLSEEDLEIDGTEDNQ